MNIVQMTTKTAILMTPETNISALPVRKIAVKAL